MISRDKQYSGGVLVVFVVWPAVEMSISLLWQTIVTSSSNKKVSYKEPLVALNANEVELKREASKVQEREASVRQWHLLEEQRLKKEASQKALIEFQKNRSSADVTKSALDDF
jgi:hypothetical protein